MEKETQRFLTVKEAAELLRVSAFHIRNLIKRGELSALNVGRAFIIESDEMERFIKSKKVKGNA